MPQARKPKKATVSIPDMLGDTGRATIEDQSVAQMLNGLATQRVQLDVTKRANDHADGDLIPGESITYAEQEKNLATAEAKIAKTFPESVERLRAAVGG